MSKSDRLSYLIARNKLVSIRLARIARHIAKARNRIA